MSFEQRLLALFALLGILAIADRIRRGSGATRPREVWFLSAIAFVGAAYGAGHDAITVRISPDYFVRGKGLPEGEHLRFAAMALGAQAGCAAGLVAGAILLYVGRGGRRPPVEYARLFRAVIGVLLATGACALLAAGIDPLARLDAELPDLTSEERAAFLRVWGIHGGSYLGLALGLLAQTVRLVGARRTLPGNESAEDLRGEFRPRDL